MSVRKQLQQYLGPENTTLSGSVVKVNSNSILAATSIGVKEFQVTNPSALRIGDKIRFRGGVYLGKIPPINSVPVYTV